MSKNYYIASRGDTDDNYPGVIRGSATNAIQPGATFDPSNEAFDMRHLRHLFGAAAPVNASYNRTVTPHTFTHDGAFTGYSDSEDAETGIRGQWIRLLMVPEGISVVARITAKVSNSTVNLTSVSAVTDINGYRTGNVPAALNYAVTSYWVGGGKRTRSMADQNSPSLSRIVQAHAVAGDIAWFSGYFTGEGVIAIVNARGFRGTYHKAALDQNIFSSTSYIDVMDLNIETNRMNPMYNSTAGWGALARSIVDHGESDFITGSLSALIMRNNLIKRTNSATPHASSIINLTIWDQPPATVAFSLTSASGTSITNSIFRSTAVRTVPFIHIANPTANFADFNTFEVVDDPTGNQPIVQIGNVVYRQGPIAETATSMNFSSLLNIFPNNRMRVSNAPVKSVPAGLGPVEFVDIPNRIFLINPSSLEVGTASDSGTRGAFRPGIAFSGYNSTVNNAKAWDLISGMVISAGRLRLDGLGPWEALHPHQGHTVGTLPHTGVVSLTDGGHRIELQPNVSSPVWAWAVAKELNPTAPRNLRLRKILASMSDITATVLSSTFFDSDVSTAPIEIEIRHWTADEWNAGAAGHLNTNRQLLQDPVTAEEICSYLQIRVKGIISL